MALGRRRAGYRWGDAIRRAPRRASQVLNKLWRLKDTRNFLAMNIALSLIGLGELAFACARPCVMSSRLYSEECESSMFWLTATVWPLKEALMLAGIGNPHMPLNKNMAYGMASQLGMHSRAIGLLGVGRHSAWAAASSKDVFEGIVRVTSATQLQSLLFVLASVVPSAAAFAAADIAATKSPEYVAYLDDTCSDSVTGLQWHACRIAWEFKDTIAISVVCGTSYAFCMALLFRAEMWSPTFVYAVKQRKIRWLARSLGLHWFTLPLGGLAATITILAFKIRIMKASAGGMIALTWLSLAYVLLYLFVVAWSVDLDGILGAGITAVLSGRVFSRNTVQVAAGASDRGEKSGRKPAEKSLRSFSADSSFRHRSVLILLSIVDVLVSVPYGSWTAVGIAWAGRVIGFVLLLRTHDKSCSHTELQRTEASFGLLMDADHLKDALRAYLSGATYDGSIRMTRATYYRMESTLTVSYRWNSKEAEICPRLRLNMSRWQVAELLAAIKETGCLYVWIDRVALPQQTCKLQTTLLARMMAIYATSRITLAMRSLESESSRYHQRGWTLQEYCTAQQLLIRTQPRQEDSSFDGLAALANDEESYFESVRQWHHSRADSCRPFWLWGFSLDEGGGEVTEAMDRFKELSARVICCYPADKIRALYPLLFNTPCEDQRELTGLLDKVAEYNEGGASRRESRMHMEVTQDQQIMASLKHQASLYHSTTHGGWVAPA